MSVTSGAACEEEVWRNKQGNERERIPSVTSEGNAMPIGVKVLGHKYDEMTMLCTMSPYLPPFGFHSARIPQGANVSSVVITLR